MELNRSSDPLTVDELKESLIMLDPSLDDKKGLKLAKEIMNGKSKINIKELTEVLGCPPGT